MCDGTSGGESGNSEGTSPFEWLTSPESLDPFLLEALDLHPPAPGGGENDEDAVLLDCRRPRAKRVLHVGSGRSVLGEYLASDPRFGVKELVNADADPAAVEAMRNRWRGAAGRRRRRLQRSKDGESHEDADGGEEEAEVRFLVANVGAAPSFVSRPSQSESDGTPSWPYPDLYFDLIVDKSTLDCTLCNSDCGGEEGEPDHATADFLLEVYRLLRPGISATAGGGGNESRGGGGSAYLLVTFHSVDFIRSLLLAPGFHWDVKAFTLERRVETLRSLLDEPDHMVVANELPSSLSRAGNSTRAKVRGGSGPQSEPPAKLPDRRSPWSSSGTFDPDQEYQSTVNVLLCRRRRFTDQEDALPPPPPNREAVALHVRSAVDDWFRLQNPMLTATREASIRSQFQREMPLRSAYQLLFTPNERDNYSYDLFLEDWTAFCDKYEGHVPRQTMTDEIGIRFMTEMQ